MNMKFISFKYWLNEKFIEDSDPIEDLGIGIYTDKNFSSEQEAYDFIYKIIPALLKVEDCTKIIKDMNVSKLESSPFIIQSYFDKLSEYCHKYITIKGVNFIIFGYELKILIFKNNNLL